MIKMYINNEEVVSNKEFTISEEMLATPSTVLNNCYPALWENTKDYVSKFYFPKDYSKCIIGDGEFEKGSQRNIIKKVSGISPSFETNITKPWESLTIDGKSTQETRSGKNLIELKKGSTLTQNGVTFKVNDDYSITLNGTCNKNNTVFFFKTNVVIPSAGEYTLSSKFVRGSISNTTNSTQIQILRNSDWAGIKLKLNNEDGSKTSQFSVGKYNYCGIRIDNNVALSNYTIKIQLEEGSTATDWEQFGVMPSPDYPSEIENVKGKNLFDVSKLDVDMRYQCTTNISDEKITITSNASTGVSFCRLKPDLKLKPNTTYSIGFDFEGSINQMRLYDVTANNYINIGQSGTSRRIGKVTTNDNTDYRLVIYVALNQSMTVSKIQVEEGSIATRYVPYGNIQIVETGKNLFDKDNANILNLYPSSTFLSNKLYQSICISIEPNTTYTLTSLNHYSDGLTLGTSEEYPVAGGTVTNKTGVDKTKNNVTITSGANDKYLLAYIKWGTSISEEILDGIQIEKGPATNYEPYTEEVVNIDLKGNELCSLPNGTKDELIVKDGRAKIVKRIGKVVLNGSERSWLENSVTKGLFQITLTNIPIDLTTTRAMSNYFKGINGSAIAPSDNSVCTYRGNRIMFTYKTYAKNINGFKTWLSTHNTIVQYELKEPYEIDLGEVTLPNTLIGQNNVTLDATLETNMEISYYYSSYDLLFAGVVKKTGNISLNPRYPHYADIQVLDFKTFLSEGETLNFVIDNKTIGQAIDMVIDAIKSYGFVKGNIMLDDINEVIGAYSTDKKTAYDVFQYFSDITNSRWFTRMIDEDTVAIDFYDTDKLPVKPKIEYTEDWFCNNLIDDMSYSIKTDDYRNKQILLSDEVFGSTPYNDLLTSNGYDTSYTTTGKIASLTSAKIDGKNATFTTEANKEGGVEADIYYKPGEVGITTNNQIGAGKVIEITYIPLVEGREIIINDEEVNRIGSQLNRNGVISRYENRNDTTSSDELRQIGQTYIKYKGKAEVTLKITSRKNIYDIGDKVEFDAPLEDLSTEYMVKKKTTKYIVTANQLFYDYELSSSFNSESEINYFDNQRSKHKGNLSEGDYITRDIDITNSANIIWHDTSIDEISITGNNILDCALDSPFTD